MGMNFPSSPTVGALYPQPAVAGVPVYRWDGEKWSTQGAPSSKAPIYSDGSVPMTGQLTLIAPPVAATDAAAKSYVDTMVLKAGDTMTGPLTLSGNPTAALQAVPMQYVDTRAVRYDAVQGLAAAQQAQAVANVGMDGVLGAWASYTPAVSASAGSLGSASATGRYLTVGKITFIQMNISVTTNGTGAGSLKATLPNTSQSNGILIARENALSGTICQAALISGSNSVTIYTSSNTYPAVNGSSFILVGVYENV